MADATKQGDPSRFQVEVKAATEHWLRYIRDSYPDFHQQTYFVPPMHFNLIYYDVETVCDQKVLVPSPAPSEANQQKSKTKKTTGAEETATPDVAGSLWQSAPSNPLHHPVYQSHERDDRAQHLVLQNLKKLSENCRPEVMFVLSRLEFRQYLDNSTDAISAAAIRLLPKIRKEIDGDVRGDFDVLIIHRQYGIIFGEVKSLGEYRGQDSDLNRDVSKRLEKAVKQMEKGEFVLKKLVSDLPQVNITKLLMLPNVTTQELQQALGTNPKVEKMLCRCMGAKDLAAALARCLCKDNLDEAFSSWWQRAVAAQGPDKNMTDDMYTTLLARFVGPATTIDVPCVTAPRREMKTLSTAVYHTGLRMAILTLLPNQVNLVNRKELQCIFLIGPPGTGKTIVLGIKGLQWGNEIKEVHLLSSHKDSRAVTFLMERQLKHALGADAAVHVHVYDFENSPDDVDKAVNTLASASRDGELRVIADEAYNGRAFADFFTKLDAKVPKLHLWAAAVMCDDMSDRMTKQELTVPLRCPPCVTEEVGQSRHINSGKVLQYSCRSAPAPTDGPESIKKRHEGEVGHSGERPEHCELCGHVIADLLKQYRVGFPGADLQYRDVFVAVIDPREDLPVVKSMRSRHIPVKVVTSQSPDDDIRHVSLADNNNVTLTDWRVVSSLERRVVIGLGKEEWEGYGRLFVKSRSTSLVVWFDPKS